MIIIINQVKHTIWNGVIIPLAEFLEIRDQQA